MQHAPSLAACHCKPYLVLFTPNPFLLEAYIEGAIQQRLVVCAAVNDQRQADRGWDATAGCVQG